MERPRRGDVLELEIEDLAFGGTGVGRQEGFVVFCADTAPGERVRARIGKGRRRHAEAELVEVLRPGPSRVAPPCPYVPRCGGCRLQHIDYAATLAAKRAQVVEHLGRIGHLEDIDVRPMVPALERFGYRNRMEYSVAPAATGGIDIGFHPRGRWDQVLDLDACLLATPLGNAAREAVKAWARAEDLRGWDRRAGQGQLRHVVIREAITTGQLLVTIVATAECGPAVDRLAEVLTTACPELTGLLMATNDGVADVAVGLPTRLVWGRDWIEEEIMRARLRLSAEAFFQTNTRMTERLYAHVAAAAALDGGQVLYDLFAGVGSIGICLAAGAREVVAVELVPEAVADARANAAANQIANHRALAGDVRVVLREHRDLPPPDVAVVDPPRGGLSGGAIRRILELGPPVLVYVSCQPATFADNAARLVAGGYRLEYVQPVDMFPQTPHIEAVARFVRTGGAAG